MAEPDSLNSGTGAAQPSAVSASIALKPLRSSAPWQWLVLGARDVVRAWPVALFYGLCFWGMALGLVWVLKQHPAYTMSWLSGCLLLAPFLALGLYDTSRRLGEGLAADLGQSLTCWDRHLPSMGMLVFVVIVLELLWGRACMVMFAVFCDTSMPSSASVWQVLWKMENWAFLAAYAAVTAVFAGLLFVSTAVSLPLMLERSVDALTAAITSFRVVNQHPFIWALWAICVGVLLGAALLVPWQWPLVALVPWLVCATWHAYRTSVVPMRAETAAACDGC